MTTPAPVKDVRELVDLLRDMHANDLDYGHERACEAAANVIERLTEQWEAMRLYHVEKSEAAMMLGGRTAANVHDDAVIYMDQIERDGPPQEP